MAAILIVHSMKSILEEVCDLVVSLNLLSEKDRLNNIDEAVKNGIYRYCAVAYFCEKIKLSDIVPALSEEDFYIDGNGEKVINVLKQHPNVGKDFVRLYFKKCKYISSIAIENIIKYLAKTDVDFAERMIVVLHDNNKIAIDFYEKLHNIIHPNSKN